MLLKRTRSTPAGKLAIIGGKDSIAPLAALLGDEKLSHNARYALERNPDPAVDEALRDALGKVKGRPLVGVITSVGVRRDAKAVPALAKLLSDSDAVVARAAARAMGSIGTAEAANALQKALPNAAADRKLDVCEGLLRCAERFAAEGAEGHRPSPSTTSCVSSTVAHQVRAGALRGAILARGKEGRGPAAGEPAKQRLHPVLRRRADFADRCPAPKPRRRCSMRSRACPRTIRSS